MRMPPARIGGLAGVLACLFALPAAAQQPYRATLVRHTIEITSFCASSNRMQEVRTPTGILPGPIVASRECSGGKMTISANLNLPQPEQLMGDLVNDSTAFSSASQVLQTQLVTSSSGVYTFFAAQDDAKDPNSYVINLAVPDDDNPPLGGCRDLTGRQTFSGPQVITLTQSGCTRGRSGKVPIRKNGLTNELMVRVGTYFSGGLLLKSGRGQSPALSIFVESDFVLEPVAPRDLSIDHVEIVQAIQDAGNTVPLVADKPAVARIFMKIGEGARTPLAGVTGTLRAFRNGAELPGSPLAAFNQPITVNNIFRRAEQDDSLNFKLPDAWLGRASFNYRRKCVHRRA